MKKLLCIVVMLCMAGCAASGREVRQEQLAQLHKGETTIDQTIMYLGQPTQRITMSDGTTSLNYVYTRVQSRPENFIPVVGSFVGGADTYSTYVILTFDQQGVLKSYLSSQGGTGTGTNLASGGMRGRQPGPVEAMSTGSVPSTNATATGISKLPQTSVGQNAYLGVNFLPWEQPAIGAKIFRVAPGSSAEKAGLQKGDVIVEFDGASIQNYRQLGAIVHITAAGTTAKVRFIRGTEEKTSEIDF